MEGGITNNDWHVFTTRDAIAKRVRLVGEAVGLHDIALQPPGEAIGHRDLETLRQDLDRMAALGFNAYRFSVEWSRIEPVRPGRAPSAAGEAALQYYQTVVQEVRSRAMEPVVTLNHLTLPRWVLAPPVNTLPDLDHDFMASLRGWESTATVDAFVAFVGRVVGRLSPQVKCWITLNEPVASMIGVGYLAGLWSPGLMSGERGRSAYFNLLRAHARAYDAIKAAVANDPRVQVGLAHAMMHPRAADPRDLNLVDRTCSPEALAQFDYFFNWHLIDTLTRDRVNVSLDARYRDPELMERDARQAVDSAEMRLRQLLADVRVHVRLAQERLDDATAWFNSAATREAAFVAWRRAYGDQAANAVPAQIQAEARAAAQAALDVCKPAVLVTLAALAVAARGLDGLLQRAVDLDDFVDHAAGAVADAIRHALARTIGAWGLPAHLLIPDQAMLVDAAAALVRQARTVFAAAFDALAQRRSLEASLQAARDKLPRAQAALQDILQTLANGHQASDAFFGLPFRPRLDFIGVNYYRGVQVYADWVAAVANWNARPA